MSIQQKLQLVFPEHFQIKRVSKQISMIRQNKDKYSYEPRMSFVRGTSVTFLIDYQKEALKKYKRTKNLKNFQIKITIKKQYPAKPPILFCMSQAMIDLGLQPFRDYSQFLTVDWTAKDTLMDIIKFFPQFLDKWGAQYNNNQTKQARYAMNESFETQRVFSWSFLQTFPVSFVNANNNNLLNGFLIINCQKQIILLQQTGSNGSNYVTKDLIKISEVVSIFRSKQNKSKILLEVKKSPSKNSKKSVSMCLSFLSQDKENIVNYIIEYIKLNSTMNQGNQNQQSSEQQDDEIKNQNEGQSPSDDDQQFFQQGSKQSSPTKINIQAIKQQIILYESLVESKMTSQNVQNLVILFKKAIEYYSAIGSEEFQIYLKKMKTLMSNQMAQVLLESLQINKRKQQELSNENKQGNYNKEEFKSIIDLM